MSVGHNNEARSGNFIFTVDEMKGLTFAVQNSTINGITLGITPFPTGAKSLALPSNKIENGPVTIDIIVSEDYSEWVDAYKWMLKCKNAIENYSLDSNGSRNCTLTVIDSQNRPSTQFVYQDAFLVEIGDIQVSSNQEESTVIICPLIVKFNKFKVILPNGETIDEQYTD